MDHEIPITVKPAMRVELYTHFFKVCGFEDKAKRAIYNFFRSLGHYGLTRIAPGQLESRIKETFATRTWDAREFRFHLHCLQDFLRCMDVNGYPRSVIKLVQMPLYEPVKVNFEFKSDWKPREHQPPLIDYVVAEGRSKVLTLYTGGGKTSIFLKAVSDIGERTVLLLQKKYIVQWLDAIHKVMGIAHEDVIVVQGSNSLRALIDLARTDQLFAKIIIITAGTLANYYREYERLPDDFTYNCHPDYLWELLGVGVRGLDEVHQEYHRNFRFDLYSNVPKTVSMSATLESSDQFIERMYLLQWPPEIRGPEVAPDLYIDVLALEYQFINHHRVHCHGPMKMYNQNRFERSILKQRDMRERYLKMVTDLVFDQFLSVFENGQHCIVFAASIEMCDALLETARRRWGDILFGRYAASKGDKFEDMKLHDVTFSTLKSAGTAIDLPNLRTVIMTDSIESVQSNQQAVGRLRRMKDWPDINPRFVYIYAGNIQKQRGYHERKKKQLQGRVKSHRTLITSYHI